MRHSHFALTEVTAPDVEPFTTSEAKDHLRVDVDDDDTLIDNLIIAARKRLENDTSRALITQTWDLFMDRFPLSDRIAIEVPKAPLQSVTSIKFIDTDGVLQTLDSSKFRVDIASDPGRITPAFNEVYPSTREVTNAVEVRFVAGYGDASRDIPDDLEQAMLMLIGHWYEHRETVAQGVSAVKVPMAYEFLHMPHKTWDFT